jgi:hypothetical protein
VEDLRVVVALDLDVGAKEGGEYLAVDREVGLVLQPLNRRASSAVSPGLGVGALGGVPTRSLRR